MQEPTRPSPSLFGETHPAAAWDGPCVTIANPDFDFARLVKTSVEREIRRLEVDEDMDHLFSLSPLSTPPSSPRPSSPTDQIFSLPPSSAPGSPTISACDRDDVSTEDIAPPNDPAQLSGSTPAPQGPSRAQPLTGAAKRKARTKARSRDSRNAQRIKSREPIYGGNYQARPRTLKKYVVNAKPITTKFNVGSAANVASTGFVGLNDRRKSKKRYKLEDLVGEGSLGFDYIAWDGFTPTPILAGQQLIAVLAGKPGGPDDLTWPSMQREAAELLSSAQARCRVPEDEWTHRRGQFKSLRSGISYGTGQTKPSNSRPLNKINAAILKELNGADPFKRLAGFASSVMAHWTPDLYAYYSTHLGALFEHDPTLRRNFPTSVFTANTYNLGPRTVCFKHTDHLNLAFGLCAVTALGSFDPVKGGHLVLWQCKLVIEFPPGSTILIPSAVLAHFNVDVGDNETRTSFTQYAAGGLFSYVDYGFKTGKSYYKSLTMEERRVQDAENEKRWAFGLSLFPTIKTNA